MVSQVLGKTVLARRLALKYIYKDYDFRYEHVSDIKEIEEYLYDGRKKVIIVDDFLGQNTTELKELSDNKLYNIINYARKNDKSNAKRNIRNKKKHVSMFLIII